MENQKENFENKAILSRKEMAAYLGICLNSLDKANLPCLRVGNRVLYKKSVIDAMLGDNTITE